jgi:hypothetical protein
MRFFRVALVSESACAIALLLSGCSASMQTNQQAGPPPAVANLGMEANGVAGNRALYVQFNEAMDPATINGNTVTVTSSSGMAASGTVAYDSTFDIAEFQPSPALQDNSEFTLTVSPGAKSAEGVPLAAAYTHSFTTRATSDESPIYVKSVAPSPNTVCVDKSSPITITFSEGADINTLNSTNIVISAPNNTVVQATMSYNAANATLTLTPNPALPLSPITVTVKNVADAAGVAMKSPYAWGFTTVCSSGGTSGGGATGNIQYEAPFISATGAHEVVGGDVSIDTAGNMTVELAGAAANTTYFMQFCEAINPLAVGNASVDCVPITNISTDSNGNAKMTLPFPEGGEWAGDFYLGTGNDNTTQYSTFLAPGINNEIYMATLLPERIVNGALATTATAQDPLSSGTVSYSNGVLKFTIAGAAPNTTYETSESETNYLDGSGTYVTGPIKTDANGDGSLTTELNDTGGDIFQANPLQNAGFIGGFSIPIH